MSNHDNAALAQQLMEWFNLLSRIGCMTAEEAEEDDSMEEILRVAGAIRRMAREVQRKADRALWDEAVAELEVELDRLDLTDLRMEEEVSLQGVPPDEWLYVINLDMRQLVNLQLRLARLNNREQL